MFWEVPTADWLICSYLLPRQALATHVEKHNKTLRLIDSPALYLYRDFADWNSYFNIFIAVMRKRAFNSTTYDMTMTPTMQGKEKAAAGIEQTLSNLGTDYLDLYLIHWPGVQGMAESDERIKSLRNKIQKNCT